MIVLWVLLGAVALGIAWMPAVMRTQEARVLETARQSVGTGWYGHVVPHVDGQLRLQKPPLAYWLAELSYSFFGISAGAGRVPFVLTAWLTAGLTGHIGRRLFGMRAGWLALCATFGCVLIAHFGMLAETDVLTMLFVTAATYAYWRGIEAVRLPSARAGVWFHLGALATALALMAKGPPAIYPTLFLIAMAGTQRCWRALWTWLRCGAWATVLTGALWYAYVIAVVGVKTFRYELSIAVEGGAHQAARITYFFDLLVQSLPWTGPLLFAVWIGARRMLRDPKLRGLLVWFLSILLPLCVAAQRQRHYLLPAIPPLMLLMAWGVDRSLRSTGRPRAAMAAVLRFTTGAIAVAGIALPVAGRATRGLTVPGDWIIGATLLALAVVALTFERRLGALTLPFTAFTFGATALLLQNAWAPTLNFQSTRTLATMILADFGPRTAYLYHTHDLQLSFNLRAATPPIDTAEQLSAVIASDPRAIFIHKLSRAESDDLSPSLLLSRSYKLGDGVVNVYQMTIR